MPIRILLMCNYLLDKPFLLCLNFLEHADLVLYLRVEFHLQGLDGTIFLMDDDCHLPILG